MFDMARFTSALDDLLCAAWENRTLLTLCLKCSAREIARFPSNRNREVR